MTLRPARDEDRDAILAIRNEPDVVALGRGSTADARWWTGVRHMLWVIEDAERVVGYVISEPVSLLSIALAKPARRKGLGSHALALCGAGVALIDPENESSRLAFARAGFKMQERKGRMLVAVRK